MPKENVTSFAVAAFRSRLEKLAASQQISNPEFADIIYIAMAEFGISEEKIRATFGGTEGMVERWTKMENLPQPSARPALLKWIVENL